MIFGRLSLLWRIRLLTALVVAAVSVFGLTIAMVERVNSSEKEFHDAAGSIVLALMPMLRNTLVVGDLATTQQTFDAIVQQESVERIELLSPSNGRTIVEASDPASLSTIKPPAWFASLVGARTPLTAESVVVGGTDYGTLRLHMSRSKLLNDLWQSSLLFVAVGLFCLVGVVVIMGLAVKRGLEPLQLVTDSARRLGAGDWTERIPPVEVPEVAVVAESFNQMAETIVRREADLVRARDSAEAANRAKATFLGTMSHEIRTPLNGIIGMTELALASNPTDEQRSYLELAKSSADSLLAILSDVLDYSNIDSGQLTLASTPMDLKDMAQDIMHQFAFRSRNKSLTTDVRFLPDPPPAVVGDIARLSQVLTNLYGNAVKFTQAGSVTLEIAVVPANPGRAMVDIRVSDTGVGIAAECIESIFDPFSQADGSLTRRFGGAGLGLAISRRLVEMMGGRLTVESQLGKGSTFRIEVELPLAANT
jgi:signal transduction histidine kinase